MPDTNFDTVAGGVKLPIVVVSADGAIPVRAGSYHVTKGSLAVLTIPAPVVGQDDGIQIRVYSETAFAHTLTNAAPGFNNLGAAGDVATFTAVVGNFVDLEARNGIWWLGPKLNVSVA